MWKPVTAVVGTVAMCGAMLAAPAMAADGEGWHEVDEQWQPYVQQALSLPAERYCEDFDLRAEPIFQDLRSRVLTRWDSGAVRTATYAGPLRVAATNQSSGATVELDLSGTATVRFTETGQIDVYETNGPVGVGFPLGSNDALAPGFFRLTGVHVVDFEPDGSRSLLVDRGTEVDTCDLVD